MLFHCKYTVANHQDGMIQVSARAQWLVVHTTTVHLETWVASINANGNWTNDSSGFLTSVWIKNKERPLGEDKWAWYRKSRVSGRGLAVICTRVWGSVSSARVLARSAIGDERAYTQRPGNKAKWGWPC